MREQILVIDDEGIRYPLKEICALGGWDVVVASNGVEGMEKLRCCSPERIIVDHHMPEQDGLTTVQKIRRAGYSAAILVLTVDERQEIADDYLEAGATDFALKPIKAPDLISRIGMNLKIAKMEREEMRAGIRDVLITKGISRVTKRLILECMKKRKKPLSIEEISTNVGLAYPTVHRYLLFLTEQGEVELEYDYGPASKRGRPKNRYRLA